MKKKNNHKILLIICSGVAFLSFFSFESHSQVTDTAIYEDPIITEAEQEKTNKYFLNNWQQEGDTFASDPRKIPEEQYRKLKADEDFWYANANIKKRKTQDIGDDQEEEGRQVEKDQSDSEERGPVYVPVAERSWFQIIIWIVVVVSFLIGVAIYLARNGVSLFRKSGDEIKENKEDEEIPEDIFAINYQKEIDKAAANGNYRLAIRLMFLRLLKKMSERNIISYQQDKTNFDYLMQVQSTSYFNNFSKITRNYEYSWYGKFPVSQESYHLIQGDFDKMERQF